MLYIIKGKREAKENKGSFKDTEISLEAIDDELIEEIREEFLKKLKLLRNAALPEDWKGMTS